MDRRIVTGHVVDRRCNDDITHRSGQGIGEYAGDLGALFDRFVPEREIGQRETAILLDIQVESHHGLVRDIDDGRSERQ